VHLYGQPASMGPILEIAKRHNIKVIEDACQAHGSLYQGQKVGSLSDVACFSFYPGKNLGAAGDGGAITTNNANVAESIRLLRDHGSEQKYKHKIIGHNFRLDTLQAAVLNVKLPYLDRWNYLRQKHARHYAQLLKDAEELVVPQVASDRESVFHLYVVQVPRRSIIQKKLLDEGIQTGIHYPTPIHLQDAYHFLGYCPGTFPVSERLSQCILSLPMYAELTETQQEQVTNCLIHTLKACS
ncbi:MAG: DegT/DnrJ/EryC1/StrS family aminotransferase, partial [Candidatus Melainabacteria bacterium]|nr:DegT/DnrJ/EryC1/StrS family aminotransferase [Candidatus Melainabacteria bacterium]